MKMAERRLSLPEAEEMADESTEVSSLVNEGLPGKTGGQMLTAGIRMFPSPSSCFWNHHQNPNCLTFSHSNP